MDGFVLAVIKVLLIIAPLSIGLFSYSYLNVDFCKSLLLYSVPLAFDLGIKIGKSIKNSEGDGLLLTAVIILFLFSICLIYIGLVGSLNNTFLTQTWPFFVNKKRFVFVAVLSQTVWYVIESVLFLFVIALKKYTKKTPVRITTNKPNKYNNI